MNRRDFVRLLGIGAAGVAVSMELDPDQLLWVPGAKTFFLPPDRAIVAATESDIEALMAAVGGPFMVQTGTQRIVLSPGGQFDVQPPMFGVPSSPEQIIKSLSNEEYRLLVARGHRILASRREVVRPALGANGQLMPVERAKVLRAQGWTLSDDRSPHIVGRG